MSTNTIAYQGYAGAYSHLSCKKAFPDMQAHPCSSFAEAMFMVERGEAKLAMIPLENSTAGRVEEIYRLMPKTQLHIIREHFEPVNHCLLALPGTTLADLKTISSHPQALAQCNQSITDLGLEQIAHLDTAGSAEELALTQQRDHAAIASELAAELYGLNILKQNFQDVNGNTTRFIILSKEQQTPDFKPQTTYITTIMFTVRNIPSALFKAMGGFATNGINMVKLESYMASDTMTVSSFHADVEGHPDEQRMQYALQELAYFSSEMRVIGTYEGHVFRTRKDTQLES
ncbi:MAG: prephenate dehydratase [Pseudomonadales bacterium]